MNLQELEARLKVLEDKNRKLEGIEELTKLQRIYGYYLERGQLDEVADLFSDSPDVSVQMGASIRQGRENVRKIFSSQRLFGVTEGLKPEDYLHITIPVSGVVDVGPEGKTAKGRWYALMYLCHATPGGGACLGVGIYENDYINEDGVWKILRLRFDDIFLSPYEDGWFKTPNVFQKLAKMQSMVEPTEGVPVGPAPGAKNGPFGELMPFHYKHPVTGK